jgi:hypothetical protein
LIRSGISDNINGLFDINARLVDANVGITGGSPK